MSQLDLLTRVGNLERRLSELEPQAVADQLTPNVFSINAEGQIEENLTGKLTAKGIVFQLGHVVSGGAGLGPGKSVTHEIVWQTEAGEAVAAISAFTYKAKAPSLLKGQAAHLELVKGGLEALLGVNLEETTGIPAATARTGVHTATIIDGQGSSSFLQLNAGGVKRQIYFTTGTVTWPGGSAVSAEVEIAGFSGTGFAQYWAAPLGNGFGWYPLMGANTPTQTHLTGIATTGIPPAGTVGEFNLLAITD